MSRLTDTKRAYDSVVAFIDREVRRRRGATAELQRVRDSLDVAFYLLGWSQFEYLVRHRLKDLVEERARTKSIERHAWRYLEENIKNVTVRRRLDMIFHGDPTKLEQLHKEYAVRNDAAHDNKLLPTEAKDVSAWLEHLKELVDGFAS